MTNHKSLLCIIQQHRAPRTRFTVRVNDQHRAFNDFSELKRWLTQQNDPLSGLTDEEYAQAICPV